MLKYEQEYLALCNKILQEGIWVENERTGKRCKTIINHDFVYNVGAGEVPILTTKQCFTVGAVAEILGYYRRYTNAQQFADIGTKTWFANANDNKEWLANPNRKGVNDLGKIYGATVSEKEIRDIYEDLSKGYDNRGEIIQMYRPEYFKEGCLRPCCFEHLYSVLDGKLSLTVTQRSCDVPLGLPFNSFSFAFLLKLMAKITGNEPDKVYHKLVNVHIYEDQIEPIKEQLLRVPLDIKPELNIADWVLDLNSVVDNDIHARNYFKLTGYEHLGKISFPFSA